MFPSRSIWVIFFGSTWNGTPWVYGAEIFPQHVPSCIASLCGSIQFLIRLCNHEGYSIHVHCYGVRRVSALCNDDGFEHSLCFCELTSDRLRAVGN